MRFVAASTVVSVFFLGCQTERDTADPADPINTEKEVANIPPENLESMIDEVADDFSNEANDKNTHIPLELNERVNFWIKYFVSGDRTRFQNYLNRGETYRRSIEQTLTEHGIPTQLFYLAMIESGFVTHARSRAQAVGIWQFIKPTATRYGLRVNYWLDERRDPDLATVAAAQYLKDLNTVFQSWYLAMAAYNAGEARIVGAIMRANTRNFWELAAKHALPRETMDYVPKFIAANIVGRHPEKFGFKVAVAEAHPQVAKMTVPARVRLGDLAHVTGTDVGTLRTLNPALVRSMTPPDLGNYEVRILQAGVDKLARVDFELARYQVPVSRLPKVRLAGLNTAQTGKATAARARRNRGPQRVQLLVNQQKYTVKSGDNLQKIARRFGTSVDTIKRANNLRINRIFIGQILSIIPRRG